MSKRYINNPYEDYKTNQQVNIESGHVKSLIRNYVELILENTETEDDGRGDIYVGSAGIAYMFWKMGKSTEVKTMFPTQELAEQYIKISKKNAKHHRRRSDDRCAFLLGNAGIYAVAAVISHSSGDSTSMQENLKLFLEGYDVCKNIEFASYGGDEVLVGRAGYLSGCYWLNKNIESKPIRDEIILNLFETTVESGRQYSMKNNSPLPLMYQYHGTEYLGAAHGVIGIFHMLLTSSCKDLDNKDYKDIKQSVDFFVSLQDEEGNFPTALEDIRTRREKRLIHWCHGAPGAVFLLIKSFNIFKDQKYLKSAELASEVIWKKGLILKGPGICHGVAGNGYCFLLLYRLTKNPKYLYRAVKFMEFLTHEEFKAKARVPDRPFSLYEGTAGTVCFLIDLLATETAEFPFMDVF
ncbi:LANCL3.2 family protein [Megaselia abdita]